MEGAVSVMGTAPLLFSLLMRLNTFCLWGAALLLFALD